MATPVPIPVLLCGRIPGHIEATTEMLKPEYRVIKACQTPEEAKAALTALLSPSASESATFDGSEYPRPQLVIMGGGYSHHDFLAIYDAVEGVKTVPWIRPLGTKPDGPGVPPVPPPADEVAARVRRVVDEQAEDIRTGQGAGKIWWM